MNVHEYVGFLKEAILSPGLAASRKGGRAALKGRVGSVDRAARLFGAARSNLAVDGVGARLARVNRRGGPLAKSVNERVKQLKMLEDKEYEAWQRARGM